MTRTIAVAIRALKANLVRSLLTILGIVIGVAAIVLVVALGQGAQDLILSEIEGFGGNLIVIRPGRQPEGPNDLTDTLFADSLKTRDIAAIRRPENVPGVDLIAPAVVVSANATVAENFYRPLIFGWTAEGVTEFLQVEVAEGSLFTEDDLQRRAKVAVIGHKTRQELFGESDAIGEFISIKGQKFRVIGLFDKHGRGSLLDVDELVLLPYTTAQRDLLNIDYFNEVILKALPEFDINQVAEDVRATLRETHGITDPEKDDFFVATQEDIVSTISTVTNVLTIFLVAIASVSLIVGGVGIMNIMLVSVTERTKEIGLRKAVGATNRHILSQFLLEATILTGLGGSIGTVIAILLSLLTSFIARQQFGIAWPVSVPLLAILLGIGTATVTGLVFGLYPARKAALKDPIESLRYE